LTGTGVQFTETMKGYIGLGETEQFENGFDKGKSENSSFEFTLTIQTDDINAFVVDEDHAGRMLGSMLVPAISKEPPSAYNGVFNLFVQNEGDKERKEMIKRKRQKKVKEGQSTRNKKGTQNATINNQRGKRHEKGKRNEADPEKRKDLESSDDLMEIPIRLP
jgi:hypothetical protein